MAVTFLALPLVVRADLTNTVSAIGQYQYDSNLFDLARDYPVQGVTDPRRSDSLYTYGVNYLGKYQWGQQQLYADLSTTEFKYDHFTQLNHNEFNAKAGGNWKIDRDLTGTFEVSRTRALATYVDVVNEKLAFQTEQRETADLKYKFAADWRWDTSGYYRVYEVPLSGSPNLQLKELSGATAMKFVGVAGLTAGVSAGYISGDFSGADGSQNLSYHQSSIDFVTDYLATGHSSISAAAGYSRRGSARAADDISGATGQIDYRNQVTPKTSVTVELSRTINSAFTYTGSEIEPLATSSITGSEIDSIGTLAVNWQARYKIDVIAAYTWTYRYLPDQGYIPGTNRGDHVQYASLQIDYSVRRWLSLKPYANVQTRSSNFPGGNFNATIFGLYLIFTPQV